MTKTLARRTSSTNSAPLSLTTAYQYDALDHVTQVTDPVGNYVQTVYDADGKVSQVNGYYLQSNGTYASRMGISVRAYDAADRLISDTDIYGNVTQYSYDASGNLVQVTDPNGHVTSYQYDPMNRRTAVIDANGFKSQIVYDLAGRAIQAINPLGKLSRPPMTRLGRPTTDYRCYGREDHLHLRWKRERFDNDRCERERRRAAQKQLRRNGLQTI